MSRHSIAAISPPPVASPTSSSPLVHALNGDGYQAVMAKAALKVKDVIPSTTMRLPNIGPDATQLDKAEEGMRAAGLL